MKTTETKTEAVKTQKAGYVRFKNILDVSVMIVEPELNIMIPKGGYSAPLSADQVSKSPTLKAYRDVAKILVEESVVVGESISPTTNSAVTAEPKGQSIDTPPGNKEIAGTIVAKPQPVYIPIAKTDSTQKNKSYGNKPGVIDATKNTVVNIRESGGGLDRKSVV